MQTLEQIAESGIVAITSIAVSQESVPFNEGLTAELLTDQINRGRLSVKDAYKHFWTFIQDKEMWGLEGMVDDDCRALLPAWVDMIYDIVPHLEPGPAKEFFETATRSYEAANQHYKETFVSCPNHFGTYHEVFNPFFDDYVKIVNMSLAGGAICDIIVETLGTKLNQSFVNKDIHGLHQTCHILQDARYIHPRFIELFNTERGNPMLQPIEYAFREICESFGKDRFPPRTYRHDFRFIVMQLMRKKGFPKGTYIRTYQERLTLRDLFLEKLAQQKAENGYLDAMMDSITIDPICEALKPTGYTCQN